MTEGMPSYSQPRRCDDAVQCPPLHRTVRHTGKMRSAQLDVSRTTKLTVLHMFREPVRVTIVLGHLWWHPAGATMARWR